MLLLMLLIAVPLGLALAIGIDLADNHGERIETWIEDAHPVVAPQTSDVTAGVDIAWQRPIGNRETVRRGAKMRSAPVATSRRRRALPLH
jgi:hypothetical protein